MTPITLEQATPPAAGNGTTLATGAIAATGATEATVASAANAVAPSPADPKLERVLALLQAQEERRQDLEEVVSDLLPAINGTIRLAIGKLDQLEKSGALELLPLAGAVLQTLKRPSEVAPVKPLQLLRALRDPDVSRGLGLMLEVLRAIGAAAARPGTPSRS
jgi:uncharacterized protein YjgD (DUF1641 family)